MYVCMCTYIKSGFDFFFSFTSIGVEKIQMASYVSSPVIFLNLFYFTRPSRRGNQIKFISNFVWPCVMSSRFHTQKNRIWSELPDIASQHVTSSIYFPSSRCKKNKKIPTGCWVTSFNNKIWIKKIQKILCRLGGIIRKFQKTDFNFSNFRPVIFTK
jgi:hypothetical protein